MTNKSLLLGALILLTTTVAGYGQSLVSGVVTPNPVVMGQPFTYTFTSRIDITFNSTCAAFMLAAGTPTNPLLNWPGMCGGIVYYVPAGGSHTVGPVSQASMPPGDYYVRSLYNDANHINSGTLWTPFTVIPETGSTMPVLAAATPPMIGQPLILSLDSPTRPLASYIVAASFTTNVGMTLPSMKHIALDPDPLFHLTFPNPVHSFMSGFQGTLDATGHTSDPLLFLPYTPILQFTGLAFQAVVFEPGPNLEFSNALTVSIL